MYSRSPGDFIIYSELFDMGSVKLNMANKLTEQIIRDPNLKHMFDVCNVKKQMNQRNNKKTGVNKKTAINKMKELSKKSKGKIKVSVKKKRKKKR
jgi:uncharacterized protein YsxB (DUF464 family)